MSKEIVSGIGARYAVAWALDGNGLPAVVGSSDTPVQGTLIQGIRTLSATDPEPQRVTHYGDDDAFAQDSLPPAEVGSFTVTTAKTNITLDAYLEGNKLRTINSNVMRVGNSDKRGSEPLVMFAAYRQALDTGKASATLGSLRQWHVKIYPSTRLSPASQSFEQGATDKTYNATPTKVSKTPWAETFTEANWGATSGEFIEFTTDYHPRFNAWLGNGSKASFSLSHMPVDSSSLTVWVQDTGEVTPSSVNINATNPAFTLSSAPASGKLVFAMIETNSPGNS